MFDICSIKMTIFKITKRHYDPQTFVSLRHLCPWDFCVPETFMSLRHLCPWDFYILEIIVSLRHFYPQDIQRLQLQIQGWFWIIVLPVSKARWGPGEGQEGPGEGQEGPGRARKGQARARICPSFITLTLTETSDISWLSKSNCLQTIFAVLWLFFFCFFLKVHPLIDISWKFEVIWTIFGDVAAFSNQKIVWNFSCYKWAA